MPKGDAISLMADEVAAFIRDKGVGFNQAFSWSAHRRDIYHHRNREYYNHLFAEVRARLSQRERSTLSQSLKGERLWQHGNIIQTSCRRRKWRPEDPWGHEDESNFIFSEEPSLAPDASRDSPDTYFTPRGRIKPGIRAEIEP